MGDTSTHREHPLIVQRKAFYATWYGALTRADRFHNSWIGCATILALMSWVAYGSTTVAAFSGLVAIGFVWGTLYEYIHHRFFFHEWTDVPGLRGFRHVHLPHHIDLTDGISAGPFTYYPVMTLWFFFMRLTLGSFAVSAAFVCGLSFWYMWYEYQHDCDHLDPAPKYFSKYVQYMKSYHAFHHDHPEKNFGITQPVWDRIFNTFKRIPN